MQPPPAVADAPLTLERLREIEAVIYPSIEYLAGIAAPARGANIAHFLHRAIHFPGVLEFVAGRLTAEGAMPAGIVPTGGPVRIGSAGPPDVLPIQ